MASAVRPTLLSLRQSNAQDDSFLYRLYAAGRTWEMRALGWPTALVQSFLADQFELRQRHYANVFPAADSAILMVGNAPIGRLLIDRTLRPWRLVDIALLPQAQGQGHGAALVRDLQRQARRANAGGIDLHVAAENAGAARLYARLGFALLAIEGGSPYRRMVWSVS